MKNENIIYNTSVVTNDKGQAVISFKNIKPGSRYVMYTVGVSENVF
jgi:hypothetical protein